MKPDPFKATHSLLLTVCLTVVASKGVFAQDMQDMRLFFTPLERAALPLPPDSGTAAATVEQDAQRTDQVVTSSLSTPATKPEQAGTAVSRTAVVTFNALVSSRNGFSIVLNGLACKPFLSTDVLAYAAREVKMSQSCPHLETRQFQFIVNTHDRSLRVMREGNLLGVLGVGDSL